MKTWRQRTSFSALGVVLPVLLAAGVAACGGDDGGGEGGVDRAAAADGKRISASSGCAGCHGANGEGGIGPAWAGLLGSEVQLVDGTTVTADEAYLISAIKDPASQKVAGYPVAMPVNQLSDEDIAKVVAYVSSLGAVAPGATTVPGPVPQPLPTQPQPAPQPIPTTAPPG